MPPRIGPVAFGLVATSHATPSTQQWVMHMAKLLKIGASLAGMIHEIKMP